MNRLGIHGLVFIPCIIAWPLLATRSESLRSVSIISWMVLGFVSWSFIEYALHRWIFHWHWRGAFMRRAVLQWHMAHHARPDDPHAVAIRPIASIGLYLGLLGIGSAIGSLIGKEHPVYIAGCWMSGVALGYLCYEIIHYMAHQQQPRCRVLKRLKRYHLHHHYRDTDHGFGVTTPLWDFLCGTRPTDKQT